MKRTAAGAFIIALLGVLAYGAVKAFVIDPKTVSTVDDLLEVYYQSRNSLPPLPCKEETLRSEENQKKLPKLKEFLAEQGKGE